MKKNIKKNSQGAMRQRCNAVAVTHLMNCGLHFERIMIHDISYK